LFKEGAKLGNVTAEYNIARAYHYGLGIERDYAAAYTWYKKAADKGMMHGEFGQGLLLYQGQGTGQDYAAALALFRKAAAQGHLDATYNIGHMYDGGLGVGKDQTEAAKWFKKAAARGYRLAHVNLGVYYQNGTGVEKDPKKAFFHTEKAAIAGSDRAAKNLSVYYEKALGVDRDLEQAIMWYRKAISGILREGARPVSRDADDFFRLASLYYQGSHYIKTADTLVDFAVKLPGSVDGLSLDTISQLIFYLGQADQHDVQDRLAVALANAGFKGDKNRSADWLYQRALKAKMDQGAIDQAAAYLLQITTAAPLLDLMIDKRYEALWPALEKRAGLDLKKAIDAELVESQRKYAVSPDDFVLLQARIRALRQAGAPAQAVELATVKLADFSKIREGGKEAFWAANSLAYALAEEGKVDQGFSLMDDLNNLDAEKYPDIVSMQINRILMLMEYGYYEKAIKAADDFDPKYANDYGTMFVWFAKACSSYQLDKREEADKIFAKISAGGNENKGIYFDALLCKGDLDGAERLLVEQMKDTAKRSTGLRRFQTSNPSENMPVFAKKMKLLQQQVLARPNVQTTFNALGRSIHINGPEAFWAE
jgi:TPR repeat protein